MHSIDTVSCNQQHREMVHYKKNSRLFLPNSPKSCGFSYLSFDQKLAGQAGKEEWRTLLLVQLTKKYFNYICCLFHHEGRFFPNQQSSVIFSALLVNALSVAYLIFFNYYCSLQKANIFKCIAMSKVQSTTIISTIERLSTDYMSYLWHWRP